MQRPAGRGDPSSKHSAWKARSASTVTMERAASNSSLLSAELIALPAVPFPPGCESSALTKSTARCPNPSTKKRNILGNGAARWELDTSMSNSSGAKTRSASSNPCWRGCCVNAPFQLNHALPPRQQAREGLTTPFTPIRSTGLMQIHQALMSQIEMRAPSPQLQEVVGRLR